MGIRCGIVGLPNVGKSTVFNALTSAGAVAENYPFATIEPNVGVATLPDPRLQAIADIVQPPKMVPTAIEFVDIAGLVAGASLGEGLGNQFLAHIREVDAVAHVVRCFEDDDVAHVGPIDPRSDIDTIRTELALADLRTVERALEKATRRKKTGDKGAASRIDILGRIEATLADGGAARALELTAAESAIMRELFLLTSKPTMYIANVGDAGAADNPHVAIVNEVAAEDDAPVVAIAGQIEAEIAELDADEADAFLSEIGEDEPGVDRVIRTAHQLLGLGTFFTWGEKQVQAWTFRHGMTASQCAGLIHTDFERGFIRAEVVAYDDFVTLGGEPGAKEAGRWRLEGRDYLVAEGDVIHFRFNS